MVGTRCCEPGCKAWVCRRDITGRRCVAHLWTRAREDDRALNRDIAERIEELAVAPPRIVTVKGGKDYL